MTNLAERFDTNTHQVKKICKKLKITVPAPGYWTRRRFNNDIKPEPLIPKKQESKQTAVSILAAEISNLDGLSLIVPRRLSKSHKLIHEAKQSFVNKSTWDGIVRSFRGEIDINVSKNNLRRAFRFMNTLIRLLEQRGYSVAIKCDETIVTIFGEEIPIRLLELRKRVPTNDRWRSYDYEATGIFKFQYDHSYWRKEIKDAKDLIEDQLAKILATLEVFAEQEMQERIRREASHKKGKKNFALKERSRKKRKKNKRSLNL